MLTQNVISEEEKQKIINACFSPEGFLKLEINFVGEIPESYFYMLKKAEKLIQTNDEKDCNFLTGLFDIKD